MVVKYIGVLFVFLTLTFAGRYKSSQVKAEISAQRRLLKTLTDAKISIKSERTRASVIKTELESALKPVNSMEAKAAVAGLTKTLGSMPIDGQLLLFEGCEERLRQILELDESAALKKQKLYSSLGVLAGAFVSVMLI